MLDVLLHTIKCLLQQTKDIDALLPEVKEKAVLFIGECQKQGLNIRITDTFRTPEKQNELYARGRTIAGPRVTNAKAGQSYHNWGLAFDVCFLGTVPYPPQMEQWRRIGRIGEDCGFIWGGSFGDYGHFEYHPTEELSQIIRLAK